MAVMAALSASSLRIEWGMPKDRVAAPVATSLEGPALAADVRLVKGEVVAASGAVAAAIAAPWPVKRFLGCEADDDFVGGSAAGSGTDIFDQGRG